MKKAHMKGFTLLFKEMPLLFWNTKTLSERGIVFSP